MTTKIHLSRMSRIAVIAATLVALATAPASAQIARQYTVTELGTVRADGDGSSTATSINDEGVVVGISDGDNSDKKAFIWYPGVGIQNLHPFVNFGGRNSGAYGISNNLDVAGEGNTLGNPFEFSHGFFYNPSSGLYDLNGLASFFGGQNSRGLAVNNDGVTAGWAQINGGAIYPFRWTTAAGVERLFMPGQASGGKAFAINNLNQAAGSIDLPGVTVASVWAPPGGGVTMIGFHNATAQESYGINDNGLVVGARRARNGRWAAWIANLPQQRVGLLRALAGTQQSWAYDVNNSGTIVGSAGNSAPVSMSAVAWQGARVVNLNTRIPNGSGWRLTKAAAINEVGQIVGEGIFQGRKRAFLLTPQ